METYLAVLSMPTSGIEKKCFHNRLDQPMFKFLCRLSRFFAHTLDSKMAFINVFRMLHTIHNVKVSIKGTLLLLYMSVYYIVLSTSICFQHFPDRAVDPLPAIYLTYTSTYTRKRLADRKHLQSGLKKYKTVPAVL